MSAAPATAAAFLAKWAGIAGEQLRMLPLSARDLAADLRSLEGVAVFAVIQDDDFQVIEGEDFDEGFDNGIWISPSSGEVVHASRISFYADLKEAAERQLHGLGGAPGVEPGA